jgi:type III restriction enzyme
MQGRRANTRKILRTARGSTRSRRPMTRSSRGCCATSAGGGKGEIVVLNDEAHHCYQDKPLDGGRREDGREDARPRGQGAQRGRPGVVQGAAGRSPRRSASRRLRPVGHAVLPEGLGLQRGLHLPVDGERLLADGRHRVRHREGAEGAGRRRRHERDLVTYLRLWDHVGTKLPKRRGKKAGDRRRVGSAGHARRGDAQRSTAATRSVREVGETISRPLASRRR